MTKRRCAKISEPFKFNFPARPVLLSFPTSHSRSRYVDALPSTPLPFMIDTLEIVLVISNEL
jgi:hypothetical protein